jgi:hypothetical protein
MAKWLMQKGIVPLLNRRENRKMKTIFAIAALVAAGLAANGAKADTVHRQIRAGAEIVRHMPAASFQSLYQRGSVANDCDGQRVFGFCPVH